uniref:Uncharacterized protein n=1 Tax=Romanomermis culicivorax TaxID=13658 RepID=A0A915KG14_ROMCU
MEKPSFSETVWGAIAGKNIYQFPEKIGNSHFFLFEKDQYVKSVNVLKRLFFFKPIILKLASLIVNSIETRESLVAKPDFGEGLRFRKAVSKKNVPHKLRRPLIPRTSLNIKQSRWR